MLTVTALCAALLATGAYAENAQDKTGGFTGEIEIFLDKALHSVEQKPEDGVDLLLYFIAEEGQWKTVWGKGFGISEHEGIVTESKVTSDTIELKLALLVNGDFWIKGRWPAAFTLRMKRGEGGELTGRYQATLHGRSYEGAIDGRVMPRRALVEGFKLPKPNEHPRVLFRKEDLPRLKEKLKTPFGQAYLQVAKNGGPINLGVLFQVTGDKQYADRAREMIAAEFGYEKRGDIPVFGFGSGGFGHDIFKVAVTFDLCQEAWPDAFNTWIRGQLEAFTERQQKILMTSHANFHPCSNYYGPGRAVPGVTSMVLWGDPGEKPKPPKNPVERAWPVKAPDGFKPGKGVTVSELESGKVPTGWIWSGLVTHESSRDLLHAIGGYGKARPGVGTSTKYTFKTEKWFDHKTLTFEALPEAMMTKAGIDLDKAGRGSDGSASVYYTAVRVPKEMLIRLDAEPRDLRMWISGTELQREHLYRLTPGVHPMTVEHRTRVTRGVLRPVVDAVTEDTKEGPLALYNVERLLYERALKRWEETGTGAERQLWLHRGWFQNYQHYRWGVGDGGFMAETGGYASISTGYPLVYASMYPNFFGRPVSPHPDISHVMVRQFLQTAWPEDGAPRVLKLNSAIKVGDLGWMAASFPITPEKYRPSALWIWNYLAGVTNESNVARLFSPDNKRGVDPLAMAQTFINYPLDMKPVHPSLGLPKTWEASTFGFYVFRSGWKGADDVIAQIFAKAAPVNGWNHPNAGGFQLYGLGHAWTTACDSRNGVREKYSVVLLPEDDINQSSCGRITHHSVKPDGSGSLTINMDDVYSKRSKRLYGSMLRRHAEQFNPSGITGSRALAFDYSGKSGAPLLMVMVDRIKGGGKKVWTWQKPAAKCRIIQGGFTLDYPDASLRAVFVTPEGVKVESASEDVKIGEERTGFHGTLHRVKATGGDDFFVIITLQRGEAPPVKVTGKGLDAKVTVGEQTVRYDGERVIIGE